MKLKVKETKIMTREATREEIFAIDIVKNNPHNDTFYTMASNFLFEIGYVNHSIIYNIEDKTVKCINIQVKDVCIRNATDKDIAMFAFYLFKNEYNNPWDVCVDDMKISFFTKEIAYITNRKYLEYMKTHEFIIED